MFAGHVGIALAVGRVGRRVNVGVFVAAALLLDALLWLFVLAGRESAVIPADFARTHQPEFVFPWSHSLAAGLAWSLIAAAAGWAVHARLGAAALAVLCLPILALTVAGMTIAPPAPSAPAMAASSLVTLVAVCALFGWLGRLPRDAQA